MVVTMRRDVSKIKLEKRILRCIKFGHLATSFTKQRIPVGTGGARGLELGLEHAVRILGRGLVTRLQH